MGEALEAKASSNYFAKITRPSTHGSVIRERLISRLDKGCKKPITWVCGPGGCGKTTAVSSYIEAKHYPSLWYQADKSDQDLATFFYNLGLAADRSFSTSHQPLPLLTAEYLNGVVDFSRNFFSLLFGSLKQDAIIVIDNLQEIKNCAPVYNAIIEGLSIIQKNIRFILISREDPPNLFVKIRANRLMDVVGWSDLRFTFEEFKTIVNHQRFSELSDEILKDMYRMLDGWVAGLQLVLENARMRSVKTITKETWSREEIFDYFGDQILNNLPADVQTFLLITSILPSMTASMARKLSGYASAEKFLNNLHKNNQFTEKRIFENEVFTFHPLFREFLLKRAQTFLLEDHYSEIKNKAAKLLMINGQKEEAVELFAGANAWDDIERIIVQDAQKMMTQGRYQVLQEWLEFLPEEKVSASAWLLYWSGACYMPCNAPKSRKFLEQAYEHFKANQDPTGLFMTCSDVITTFITEFINFRPIDFWINEIDSLLAKYDLPCSTDIETRFVISVFSALLFRQPFHPDMDKWTEKMERIIYEAEDMNLRFTAGSRLILHYVYQGDFSKAIIIYSTLRYQARSDKALDFHALDWLANEIPLLWLSGLHDKGMVVMSEGLALSRKSGIQLFNSTFYALGVWISLGKGDHKTAKRYLDQMAGEIPSHRINDIARYYYLNALLSSLKGEYTAAAKLAEKSLELAVKSGFWVSIGFCSAALCHLCTELGRYDEAAMHLERMKENTIKIKNHTYQTHMYYLYSAYLFLAKGDENKGISFLRKGMTLAREQRFFETPWWHPDMMAKLCAKALESKIEVSYVQKLIQRRKLYPDEKATSIETWPWPIKIYTFGNFEMMVNGQSIQESDKFTQKPLSMLKALIAFGGKNVRETEISDALWPDADGDQAHRAFATTLHRLRKLLDLSEAVLLRGKKLSLNDHFCWVDTWAMERQLDTAEKTNKDGESISLKTKVFELYKGSFLHNDVDEPWMIQPRDHFRKKFLRIAEDLGDHLEDQGLWNQAIDHYQIALDVEPTAEMLYRRLMNCYKNINRMSEALAVYDRCSHVLKNLLDIIPSTETQLLQSELKEA